MADEAAPAPQKRRLRQGLARSLGRPLLITGFGGQASSLAARIGVSYQALSMGLSPLLILVIASIFSFLPIFLAMGIGRLTDRLGAGPINLVGAVAMLIGCGLPLALPWQVWALALGMGVLGIGQTLQLAACQAEISQFGSARMRDRLVGRFMVYQAIGQVLAPTPLYLTGLFESLAPAQVLLWSAMIQAVILFAAAIPIRAHAHVPRASGQPVPLHRILATPGLVWLAISGCLCVAVQDLTYVYLPILAEERAISPALVGTLLAGFSGAQLLARLGYAPAVRRIGRLRLMVLGLLLGGGLFSMLVLPFGAVAIALVLVAAGLGQSLAITSSVTMTMQIAPPTARGTTMALRLAVNRTGQFLIPLISGSLTASLAAFGIGTGGVFLIAGVMVAATAICPPKSLNRDGR